MILIGDPGPARDPLLDRRPDLRELPLLGAVLLEAARSA